MKTAVKVAYPTQKGKQLKTRLGVDKVKPKGWFKYSLQID